MSLDSIFLFSVFAKARKMDFKNIFLEEFEIQDFFSFLGFIGEGFSKRLMVFKKKKDKIFFCF